METFGILFGLVFWPFALFTFWRYTYEKRWSLPRRKAGCCLLLTLPVLGALSMAHWMFLDEPLLEAARTGDVHSAQTLLRWSAFVNVHDDLENTPLLEASTQGNAALVRLLLSYGADPQAANRDGRTPLKAAQSNQGHVSKASADVKFKPDYPTVINLLKQAGAR